MNETPDNPEAQSMLSNGTQQATRKETSAEESKAAPEAATRHGADEDVDLEAAR
jgi:hypothetical protein